MKMVCARCAHACQFNSMDECEAPSADRNLVSIYLQITYILFDTTSMRTPHSLSLDECVDFFISVLDRMANENK